MSELLKSILKNKNEIIRRCYSVTTILSLIQMQLLQCYA